MVGTEHHLGRPRRAPAVLYEKDGPVGIVSLNRPEVLNAYNVAMRDALFEALQAVRDDPGRRHAMVLRGNGPAFSTGGDVTEFGSAPSPVAARDIRWHRDVWGLLHTLPKPTVVAVHGYAVGGGFEMALLCDLCIAAEDTRFRLPETALAMIPGVAGTQTTPRLIGVGRALDLILTDRWLTAAEGMRLGFVARIVTPDQLRIRAVDLARRLCELPPALVAQTKRAVNEGGDLPLAEGLALERRMASSRN